MSSIVAKRAQQCRLLTFNFTKFNVNECCCCGRLHLSSTFPSICVMEAQMQEIIVLVQKLVAEQPAVVLVSRGLHLSQLPAKEALDTLRIMLSASAYSYYGPLSPNRLLRSRQHLCCTICWRLCAA